jgi:hypothetical protein
MLPPDLARAADSLQERFRLLRLSTRTIPDEEWGTVAASIRDMVPSWLRELLGKYELAGGVLEYRDRSQPRARLFRFFDAANFSSHLGNDSLTRQLIDYHYLPFASESDGSVWVIPTGNALGPVSLLELAEWNGGLPTIANGLRFATSRLEFLLASMAVSEASYYGSSEPPRCVMWYSAT